MSTVTLAIQQLGGTFRRFDRVVLATGAIFVLLTLAVPIQAVESVRFTLDSLLFIAPFFVLSVLIAASVKAAGLDRQIASAVKGRPHVVIVLAALFGALSPFCSCGVIPIVAALLAAGVPLAPVMAFWVSSPLMDPEMFILMAAVLGPQLAAAKALGAFVLGLVGGFATHALAGSAVFAAPLRGDRRTRGCTEGASPGSPELIWTFWRHGARRRVFADEGRETGWFLLKWLTLAFVLESLMVAYLSPELIGGWLGADRWWVIPASVLVGVPAYLNGYAAIPTVNALIELGMAPGAGLAFMVAGGVTSLPASMAVFALVKRNVFIWYLALGLAGSLAIGFTYEAVA
ncbi:MAG: permease [Alphaproteobacteria bacterium]